MINKNFKQLTIFYVQSVTGIIISHFIPTKFLIIWIIVSLYIGHLINKKNYQNKP